MADLPGVTWPRFLVWLAAGLGIYAIYGRTHSRVRLASSSRRFQRSQEPPIG
jgi:basic amino acid/polyamine antiporter, APA family